MYINRGVFTTSTANIGKTDTPIYMTNGVFTPCSGVVVTSGTQTFSGNKTFSSDVKIGTATYGTSAIKMLGKENEKDYSVLYKGFHNSGIANGNIILDAAGNNLYLGLSNTNYVILHPPVISYSNIFVQGMSGNWGEKRNGVAFGGALSSGNVVNDDNNNHSFYLWGNTSSGTRGIWDSYRDNYVISFNKSGTGTIP
jgi:hypothetical protein